MCVYICIIIYFLTLLKKCIIYLIAEEENLITVYVFTIFGLLCGLSYSGPCHLPYASHLEYKISGFEF